MRISIRISLTALVAALTLTRLSAATGFNAEDLSAQVSPLEATPACLPAPAGLVSWWPANGNANDLIGSNMGTLVGNVLYTNGAVNQAFRFDGASYVRVPNNPTLNPTGSFSLECWVYPSQEPAAQEVLVAKWGDNGELSNQRSYALDLWPGRVVNFSLVDAAHQTDHAFAVLDSAAGAVALNAWSHVVAVYDQSTGTRTLYINGVNAAQRTDAPITVLNSSAPLSIGAWYRAASWVDGYFQGSLDEVSLYNRALSAADVQALYVSGSAGKCFAPAAPVITTHPLSQVANVGAGVSFNVIASGTQPLSYQWRFNYTNLIGQTTDRLTLASAQLAHAGLYSVVVSNLAGTATSSNALLTVTIPVCVPPPSGLVSWWQATGNFNDTMGTNAGMPVGSITFTNGEVGSSFNFNGSGYIISSNSPSLNPTGSFSVEAWVYPAQNVTAQQVYFAKWSDNGAFYNQRSYGLSLQPGNAVRFSISDAAHQNDVAFHLFDTPTNAVTPQVWNHLVAVYDQSTGTRRVYVNGTRVAERTDAPITVLNSTAPLMLGALYRSGSWVDSYFRGGLDEVSFYNRVLSVTEVQVLYASGSAGKCFNLVAPTITSQPTSQSVFAGSDVSFSVSASGTAPLSYQWLWNGGSLAGKTNASLTLTGVQLANAGTYSVVVSNIAGAVLSSNAMLAVTVPECVNPPAGIVSWWRAEGNSLDSISGNNGIASSTVVYGAGEVGQGFVLNGTTANIRVPYTPNQRLTNAITLEAWVQPTRNAYQNIFNRWDAISGLTQKCFSLALDPSGRLYMTLSPSGTDAGRLTVYGASGGVPVGQWSHVAGTYDGRIIKVYVNGVLQGSGSYTAGIYPGTNEMTIGSDGPLYFFAGRIDEAAMYSRALTAEEIQALYYATVSGRCTTPPSIVTQPENRAIIEGSTATFSVKATGTPVLHYQWLFNGTNLAGATGASLTLTNAQWTNAGVYSVLVANAFGGVVSSNAVLAVDRIPVARAADVVVAAGADCTALALVDQGSFDPDGDALTLSQFPAGPYPLGTNLVTLRVTDSHGASNACTALVVVLDQTPPALICPADSVVTNAHNAWTSVVTYAASASDNCSGVGVPVCEPSAGSTFGLGTTTVNCSVADAAGNTTQGRFQVTVLPGNVAPVPVIDVLPLAHFPGHTNLTVIAPDNQQASVVLDGSRSYDVDDTAFLSLWTQGTNVLGTNLVSTNVLGLGTNEITLWLDDTFPLGTNCATVQVEVITPAQAVRIVADLLQDPPGSHLQPLLASLNAARAAFERGNFRAGLNELQAFQNKVSAQLAPEDPERAEMLSQAAQQILNAFPSAAAGGSAHVKFLSLAHRQGKMHLKFAGPAGKVHLVQASTNLVDWQTVGVAADLGNGAFEFEDAKGAGLPARFYRIVAP